MLKNSILPPIIFFLDSMPRQHLCSKHVIKKNVINDIYSGSSTHSKVVFREELELVQGMIDVHYASLISQNVSHQTKQNANQYDLETWPSLLRLLKKWTCYPLEK